MREETFKLALHCTLRSYYYSIYISLFRFLNSDCTLHTNTLFLLHGCVSPGLVGEVVSGFRALDMRGVY